MNVAPSTLTACVLALAAFATALMVGELARNPLDAVLQRALLALAVCWIAGFVVGRVFEMVIADHRRSIEEASAREIESTLDEGDAESNGPGPAESDDGILTV